MKDWKRVLILILINIIPVTLLLVNFLDLFDAVNHSEKYPFESEFFSPISIYKSRATYLIYNIGFAVLLLGLILTSIFKGHKMLYFFLLAFSVIALAYPMLTNE